MPQLWTLGPGSVDASHFFRVLPLHFHDATSLFAEGTSIEPDVRALYLTHAEAGRYLPGLNTIWPESVKLRCRFSASLCVALAEAAQRHAAPELLDHLFLYAGDRPLLEWPDAFACELYLPPSHPESRVTEFAGAIGLPHELRSYG